MFFILLFLFFLFLFMLLLFMLFLFMLFLLMLFLFLLFLFMLFLFCCSCFAAPVRTVGLLITGEAFRHAVLTTTTNSNTNRNPSAAADLNGSSPSSPSASASAAHLDFCSSESEINQQQQKQISESLKSSPLISDKFDVEAFQVKKKTRKSKYDYLNMKKDFNVDNEDEDEIQPQIWDYSQSKSMKPMKSMNTLEFILRYFQIFSRMNPDDKSLLVQQLQRLPNRPIVV